MLVLACLCILLPGGGAFCERLASSDNLLTLSGCMPRKSTTSVINCCSSFVILPSSQALESTLLTRSSPTERQEVVPSGLEIGDITGES